MPFRKVCALFFVIVIILGLIPFASNFVITNVGGRGCCNNYIVLASPVESVTLTYFGRNSNYTPGLLGPVGAGGTLYKMTIPTPPSVNGNPNAWVLNYAQGELYGLRFSSDNFITNFRPTFAQLTSTLVFTNAHLIESDSEDGNPLNTPGTGLTMGPIDDIYFAQNQSAGIGSIITVSVNPSSTYSVEAYGGLSTRYFLSPLDQSLVQLMKDSSDPTGESRIITMQLDEGSSSSPAFTTLDPNFDTPSQFFNIRLGVILQWTSGRAVPTSLKGPSAQELLTPSYLNTSSAFPNFYQFYAQTAFINLSNERDNSGFFEMGIPITGSWTFKFKILDPNTLGSINKPYGSIGGTGLTGEVYGEYEIVNSTQYTLAPGASKSFFAPDLTSHGWYLDGYSTVHLTSQTCPSLYSCDVDTLTTNGIKAYSASLGNLISQPINGLDRFWFLFTPNVTITNPATNSRIETFTMTYSAEYVSDITLKIPQVSDVVTSYNSTYNLNTISIPLGAAQPDASLVVGTGGFNSLGSIEIMHPGFNWPTYRPVQNPTGGSADQPLYFAWQPGFDCCLTAPYVFGFTGAEVYYTQTQGVAGFYPWGAYGANGAGTWTVQVLQPVTTLSYTKTGGDILVTDPNGNREGSDTVHVYNEIPGATYSGPGGTEVVTIPNPIPGTYLVQVTGRTAGTYAVSTSLKEASSTIQVSVQSGSISPGQVILSATVNDPTQPVVQTIPLSPAHTRACPQAKQGANLSGADLTVCNLTKANLSGANLQGALLMDANLTNANLQGANLNGANLSGAILKGANLQGDNLQNANLEGVNMVGANLQGANLQNANLQAVNATGDNFKGDNLQGAMLQGANLSGANLSGANLQGADMNNANLRNANMSGANCQKSTDAGATTTGVNTNGSNSCP